MHRLAKLYVIALCFAAVSASAQWKSVVPGVDYQRFTEGSMDVHVTRLDLTEPGLQLTVSSAAERGMKVSDFAKKHNALVAVNADYFTKDFQPIGLAIGHCGTWPGTKDTTREGVVAIGDGRVEIYTQREVMEEPADWIDYAVSGWPMLVRNCEALTATQLPGSDGFTRAPHPRTAVGVSEDGMMLYLVVAEGRREGVPGLTLARLARFMAEELGVCAAINLDGGGSSAMWLEDAIVNHPSDGFERPVAVHLGIVQGRDAVECEQSSPKRYSN